MILLSKGVRREMSQSSKKHLNNEHRLDLSEIDSQNISKEVEKRLEKIVVQKNLAENELSLMGLAAKKKDGNELEITLLLSNGTNQNLEIKQLPLNFYDATGDIVAQGTFQLAGFKIYANTSKPMSLVFPKKGILTDKIDLSKWSVRHAK